MIIAFIPAREGSKGIRLKNIKDLAGKPLVQWTINAAYRSRRVNKVVVSTDSRLISDKIRFAHIFWRSPETATDTAQSELALIEYCKRRDNNDIIVFIQATSPLLKTEEIDRGIEKLLNGYDSAVSVVRQKRFLWSEDGVPGYDLNNRPRRQDHPGFLVENGAFYISRVKDILKSGCRISGKIAMVECSPESYIELDEPVDWLIAEMLCKY